MSRLRNRMVKADFWTDPELLRWPLGKRVFYQGLWAAAEDSGCLEDDPFGWKLQLFPSPVDAELSTGVLESWRDELIACGKLYPYEADGKRYLFIRTFHQHEHPRNPQRPDLPLPAWLIHSVQVFNRDGSTCSRNAYSMNTDTLPLPNGNGTVTVLSPPPRPAPSRVPTVHKGRGGDDNRPVDESTVRPVVAEEQEQGPPRPCSRCGENISDDDMLDDGKVVDSSKGIRHKECPA